MTNGFKTLKRGPVVRNATYGWLIFTTGAVLRHGIISEKWDGRFVSDHYPVLAEVVVREKG
jgi:hypothetical protein